MSQCVPSWDLEDIYPNHDLFKLDYKVAELKWQKGQLAMQELGNRRVPTKSQPTTSWDNPRATGTLETIVNQATHKPCYKPQVMVNDNEIVPWLNSHKPTVTTGNLKALATMTADALVPSSNNRIIGSDCSTRVSSCSGTFGIGDTYDGDHLDGQRLTTNSMGSPEKTSSGRDCSMSTFLDDSVCHCSTQREGNVIKEKKKGKAKSSILNKRRTAASHNQSERKRRDKINQRMTTLQKLVPNSSKTDKASMLDEVMEYVKQLQAQVHMSNSMNMSPLMMPLVMQQQQQQMQQMSMMNSKGMGMGLGLSSIPYPSIFMPMPSWNSHPADPMSTFVANHTQPLNMDSYNWMAALYQHMQNQACGPLPKN